MNTEITYRFGNDLDLDQVIELYRRSTLGERRPVDDRGVMDSMLKHGNLTITAWSGDKLVGISRSLTDFGYVAYLADLAVDAEYQKSGIGKRLIEETRLRLGPKAKVVLLAAPAAVDYYPRIGFRAHPSAWIINGEDPLL
jgi:predicted N-acetyltransferase YhbS